MRRGRRLPAVRRSHALDWRAPRRQIPEPGAAAGPPLCAPDVGRGGNERNFGGLIYLIISDLPQGPSDAKLSSLFLYAESAKAYR